VSDGPSGRTAHHAKAVLPVQPIYFEYHPINIIGQSITQVAYFFVKIPSHMGYVFIPRHVVQKISEKGNQFGLKVQLETGDKNSRTYSNTLVITDMMTTIPERDQGFKQ
jgi:hypothetical protein